MTWILDLLGPVAAIGSWLVVVVMVWKWGITGLTDRMQAFTRRLAHGPKPRAPRAAPDYAEIARLEREVFGP